jgi:hypothetical protein
LLVETEDKFDFGALSDVQKNVFLVLYDCLKEDGIKKDELIELKKKLMEEYLVYKDDKIELNE